eukprot:gene4900-6903_t
MRDERCILVPVACEDCHGTPVCHVNTTDRTLDEKSKINLLIMCEEQSRTFVDIRLGTTPPWTTSSYTQWGTPEDVEQKLFATLNNLSHRQHAREPTIAITNTTRSKIPTRYTLRSPGLDPDYLEQWVSIAAGHSPAPADTGTLGAESNQCMLWRPQSTNIGMRIWSPVFPMWLHDEQYRYQVICTSLNCYHQERETAEGKEIVCAKLSKYFDSFSSQDKREQPPAAWFYRQRRLVTLHNETCKHSSFDGELMVDDLGIVCSIANAEGSGCCYGPDFPQEHCCRIFEFCVSCCLSPDNIRLREEVFRNLSEPLKRVLSLVSDQFEYCEAKCRTSSQSVHHENKFRDSSRRHCFGANAATIVDNDIK